MTTFTIRDLDRTPRKVLETSDAEGVALIRTRGGRLYEIRPAAEPGHRLNPSQVQKWLEGHARWQDETFPHAIPKSQCETVDRLIAGE